MNRFANTFNSRSFHPARRYIKWFIIVWLPLLLALAAAIWALYQSEVTTTLAIVQNNAQQTIRLGSKIITSELSILRSDALYIADQSSLQAWLDTGTPSARQHLVADMLAFAHRRKLYDQIRFLDKHGQELVRIQSNNGQPVALPSSQLQNKFDRYYVQDTLALAKDHVYISPFDLNIEHKKIELPLKPMIRFATPVFDHNNHLRGLVVLNYNGQRLLEQLTELSSTNHRGVWLLNADGYWLLGPDKKDEWGFMYSDRHDVRFSSRYQKAWKKLTSGAATGQFMQNGDLFSYSRISGKYSQNVDNKSHLILVSRISSDVLAQKDIVRTQVLSQMFVGLGLLLAFLSSVISFHIVRRQFNEASLRASELRFRKLLGSAPDAIIIVNQQGYIELINSQTEKWFGYKRRELQGQPVETLVPERFRGSHIGYRENYTAHPVPRAMGAETDLYALRKDGSEFPVEISLSPLETEQGVLVISIIRDITQRKKIEQDEYDAQIRYRELVDNLPVGIYRNTPGPEGRFLEINQAMVDIFEAENIQQLFESSISSLYSDSATRVAFSEKIMRQGSVNSEELQLQTLRGREFVASITAVSKEDLAGQVYFDGIIEDISERKENERRIRDLNRNLREHATELEAINYELEAFSYSVSHDLRAPLRAIDGFSRILLDDYIEQLDDKGKDHLQRVRKAAQHMAVLIDDLLKLSRVSRVELKPERVSLSEVAQEVIDTLAADPQRQVQVLVQPGMSVRADRRLLRVVMDNLLGNAWKFTAKSDNACIEVGAVTGSEVFTCFVRDNGAGFDMAYVDKLFKAFQRLHDTHEFPGTGIGLATVQRVIHKHGGRIWVEAELNHGATFYFTLEGLDI